MQEDDLKTTLKSWEIIITMFTSSNKNDKQPKTDEFNESQKGIFSNFFKSCLESKDHNKGAMFFRKFLFALCEKQVVIDEDTNNLRAELLLHQISKEKLIFLLEYFEKNSEFFFYSPITKNCGIFQSLDFFEGIFMKFLNECEKSFSEDEKGLEIVGKLRKICSSSKKRKREDTITKEIEESGPKKPRIETKEQTSIEKEEKQEPKTQQIEEEFKKPKEKPIIQQQEPSFSEDELKKINDFTSNLGKNTSKPGFIQVFKVSSLPPNVKTSYFQLFLKFLSIPHKFDQFLEKIQIQYLDDNFISEVLDYLFKNIPQIPESEKQNISTSLSIFISKCFIFKLENLQNQNSAILSMKNLVYSLFTKFPDATVNDLIMRLYFSDQNCEEIVQTKNANLQFDVCRTLISKMSANYMKTIFQNVIIWASKRKNDNILDTNNSQTDYNMNSQMIEKDDNNVPIYNFKNLDRLLEFLSLIMTKCTPKFLFSDGEVTNDTQIFNKFLIFLSRINTISKKTGGLGEVFSRFFATFVSLYQKSFPDLIMDSMETFLQIAKDNSDDLFVKISEILSIKK